MANTKISQLTPNTNPNGWEELVYAYNNTNGKMTLNTMKWYVENNLTWYVTDTDLATDLADKQDLLISWGNIKTINGNSVLWWWDLVISWWQSYTAWTWIGIAAWEISNTWVLSVNWQTGNVVVSWWSWDGWYDCVVAADWTGNYTTIWAAVAAWKINIFVKNWAYTEAAWWDASTSGKLSITWESREWVVITIPNTATASSWSKFINMWTWQYAYIKNVSFNISFTSAVRNLFYETESMWFKIEDCDFTYSSTYNWAWLFYMTAVMTGASVDTVLTTYKNPQRWVYWCTFYTETNWTTEAYVNRWDMYFERCNFSTWAAAWLISIYGATSETILNRCYVSAYSIKFDSCSLHFSSVEVTSWTSSSEFDWIFNSKISFSWVTWTMLSADVVENSDISLWTVTASLWSGNWTHNIINSQISASAITVWWHATNNRFTWPITFDMQWKNIIWNRIYWNITLSESNIIFIWNNYDWYTLTDSWTWNVKANNIS